jgi:hypothetical protein
MYWASEIKTYNFTLNGPAICIHLLLCYTKIVYPWGTRQIPQNHPILHINITQILEPTESPEYGVLAKGLHRPRGLPSVATFGSWITSLI